MEGILIRKYMPILNTQIPKENDWTKYEYREVKPEEFRKLFECKRGGRPPPTLPIANH